MADTANSRASLALAGLLASSEKRRRLRRLQADLMRDGWKPEGGRRLAGSLRSTTAGPEGHALASCGNPIHPRNTGSRKGRGIKTGTRSL